MKKAISRGNFITRCQRVVDLLGSVTDTLHDISYKCSGSRGYMATIECIDATHHICIEGFELSVVSPYELLDFCIEQDSKDGVTILNTRTLE